jgi:two-component system, chemotaxis family, CheB/CheR fusion protein
VTPPPRSLPTGLDAAALDGLRVLVVDDDPGVRDAIASVLRDYGGRVTAVGSVIGAMAAIRRERPDIILSDLRMPGHDGYDLIRKIRTLPAELGGAIPAIALTALDDRAEQRRAIRAGFYLLVPKPVSTSGLVRAVAAVVTSQLESNRSRAA